MIELEEIREQIKTIDDVRCFVHDHAKDDDPIIDVWLSMLADLDAGFPFTVSDFVMEAEYAKGGWD